MTKYIRNHTIKYSIVLFSLLWILIFVASIIAIPENITLLSVAYCIANTSVIVAVATLILMALPKRTYKIHPYLITVLTLILFLNMLYCRVFGDVISFSMYKETFNLMSMETDNVTALFNWLDSIFIVIIIIAFIALNKLYRKIKTNNKPKTIASLLCVAIIIPLIFYHAWNKFNIAMTGYSINDLFSYGRKISEGEAIINFTMPVSIFHEIFIVRAPYPKISDEQYASAKKYCRKIAEQNIRNINTNITTNKNIIIILVESLNTNGLNDLAMPFTTKLAKDSNNIFIPQIKDQVGKGVSMDGQILILTGLFPNMENFTFTFPQQKYKFNSIQQAINKIYKTNSIIATITDSLFWKQNVAAKAFGINKIISNELIPNKTEVWLDDKTLFKLVIQNLIQDAKIDKPFIYTILTGESHSPYNKTKTPLRELPDSLNQQTKNYFAKLQNTDKEIENLFNILEQNKIINNTTVIITADHCIPEIHNYGIADQIRTMPLLIVNPSNNPKFRPIKTTYQISVYPTIMHALGIVDSTYMGLTPSMISPNIEEYYDNDFTKIQEVSKALIYYK